jgi:hypothetical protein
MLPCNYLGIVNWRTWRVPIRTFGHPEQPAEVRPQKSHDVIERKREMLILPWGVRIVLIIGEAMVLSMINAPL